MKSLALSMLAIASIAAMSSCSSENDPVDEVIAGNQEKVEIKLSAGVVGIQQTKAPITTKDSFTPSIVGWDAADQPTTTTVPLWITTPDAAIAGDADKATITLSNPQYYNPDNTKHTYIRGYFPVGSPADGKITFDNTNGDQDVMMTEVIDAGTKDATKATELTFSHKLSQLNIAIQKDVSLPAGVTLTSITLKNANIPTGFDIVTGTITYTTSDLSIDGITAGTSIDTKATVGKAVMVEPFSDTKITLDVVTSQGTFEGIPVTLSAADENGGTSYEVTLTFKQKEISTTASVKDWTPGTGTGDVF